MLNDEQLQKETQNVIKWVKEFVKNAKAKGVVLGLSGGKDSATVLAIACKALGNENVITVAMPCSSVSKDIKDAKMVAKTFNVPLLEIDLTKQYDLLSKEIEKKLKKQKKIKELSKEAKINIKPRLRMTTLYSIAQQLNYLVIGTGNLSEGVVGYTTKWGDNACDFGPIANFTVEEVKQIGLSLGVPDSIINKAPNDGLRRTNR
jgi:NAD+ synthase